MAAVSRRPILVATSMAAEVTALVVDFRREIDPEVAHIGMADLQVCGRPLVVAFVMAAGSKEAPAVVGLRLRQRSPASIVAAARDY